MGENEPAIQQPRRLSCSLSQCPGGKQLLCPWRMLARPQGCFLSVTWRAHVIIVVIVLVLVIVSSSSPSSSSSSSSSSSLSSSSSSYSLFIIHHSSFLIYHHHRLHHHSSFILNLFSIESWSL